MEIMARSLSVPFKGASAVREAVLAAAFEKWEGESGGAARGVNICVAALLSSAAGSIRPA